MRALILNAGSTTLKWSVLDAGTRSVITGGVEEWRAGEWAGLAEVVRGVASRSAGIDVAGHRIVHGGPLFHAAVVVDGNVRSRLEKLVDLDPLHMRAALAGIDAVSEALPSIPQIAAFDTAFHAAMPAAAAGYALPHEWSEAWGLRRFGFHGLSVSYAVQQARRMLGTLPVRMIVCHLGSGCSVTAVRDGRSLDTTMGFTPLEGMMMATRSGSVDPGLLLYLQARHGITAPELGDALEKRSGLLGVSGVSGDLRKVLAAARDGDPRAELAAQQFVWTLRRAVGAMQGVLGAVDAIIFTGGIGEHSASVRREGAAAVGISLDGDNDGDRGDRIVSSRGLPVAAMVVEAREDLVILDEIVRLTAGA